MAGEAGRFTQGSTMRHVVEMTATGAIGLMAIFVVDFLSLFYVSRLGDDRLTAGVGYATTVLFAAISINIGAMIAGSALVARKLGARDRDGARREAASALALSSIVALGVTVILLALAPGGLRLLGAQGVAHDVAMRFLYIAMPSNVLMAIGMALSGILRAVGDPRRAMLVTLVGGIVTAAMDPLLIFGLGLGTDGAAIATVIARIVYVAVGFNGVVRVHGLIEKPRIANMKADWRPFFAIAVPAILTNLATPVANLALLRILAPFGEAAIAANTILDRLVPLAFGVLFSLSAAIGPILAQNYGAGRHDRLHRAMKDALVFAGGYALVAWVLLVIFRAQIIAVFGVEGETARFVAFFCIAGGAAWIFNGFLFVANAAFNNLGFPLYSTAFNWGRATLGTIPFALAGAQIWGVEGVIGGTIVGSVIFGIAAIVVAFRALAKLARRASA